MALTRDGLQAIAEAVNNSVENVDCDDHVLDGLKADGYINEDYTFTDEGKRIWSASVVKLKALRNGISMEGYKIVEPLRTFGQRKWMKTTRAKQIVLCDTFALFVLKSAKGIKVFPMGTPLSAVVTKNIKGTREDDAVELALKPVLLQGNTLNSTWVVWLMDLNGDVVAIQQGYYDFLKSRFPGCEFLWTGDNKRPVRVMTRKIGYGLEGLIALVMTMDTSAKGWPEPIFTEVE